jgi:hypothetical protein
MARQPVTGQWKRLRTVPYVDAAKWGTGINPVHEEYGSDPARIYGRVGNVPDITPPAYASPDFIETHAPWGYQPEDLAGLDVFADPVLATRGIPHDNDDWPHVNEDTGETRATVPRESYHPWGSDGAFVTRLRSIWGGPRDSDQKVSNEVPTETVSEGWLNKPTGEPADSEPSADAQIFIQTSERQRYETRANTAAVSRATDDARSSIASRVVGQKLKVYSGGERHYDMYPFQQDDIIRPFYYRTAGTGPEHYLDSNEMYVATAMQRTPPPDAGVGEPEVDETLGTYGYTNEDEGYW